MVNYPIGGPGCIFLLEKKIIKKKTKNKKVKRHWHIKVRA